MSDLTMIVRFERLTDGRVKVWTNGEVMGTYSDFIEAGSDLGEEYQYRIDNRRLEREELDEARDYEFGQD